MEIMLLARRKVKAHVGTQSAVKVTMLELHSCLRVICTDITASPVKRGW